jgi:hypothetical protein
MVLGLKKKKAADVDTLFEDEGDLFGVDATSEPLITTKEEIRSNSTNGATREDVDKMFNQLVDHMVPRLGRKPEIATPVRRGALTQLINLANSREQLGNVTEIMKLYHENDFQKKILEDTDAGDAFISKSLRFSLSLNSF